MTPSRAGLGSEGRGAASPSGTESVSALMTASEVAAYLRVSRPTVLEWSRRGLLPCVVLRAGPSRSVRRWRREVVEALANPSSSTDGSAPTDRTRRSRGYK